MSADKIIRLGQLSHYHANSIIANDAKYVHQVPGKDLSEENFTKLEKEYLTGSTIDIEFEINDPENDQVMYSLYIYTDGTKRNLLVNQELNDSVIKVDGGRK